MFHKYFLDLWFSEKEANVFKTLYILWTKPASTVAKYLWIERTTVYKILQRLVEENIVFETNKWWIKHFFIPNIDILKTYTKGKSDKYQKLEDNFDSVKLELQEFENTKDKNIPKITIFDSNTWITNIHEDILNTTLKNKYISIRLFASNTIDSQTNIQDNLRKSSTELFQKLKDNKINIETYLGNWIMLMENISKTYDISTIAKLPASNSAINIFVVWSTLYFIIFKDSTFWIKIESEDLASTFHFLFDNIEIKNQKWSIN